MMQSILICTFMISAVLTESNISIHFDCSKLQFWERENIVCNASTPVFQCAWDIFRNRYEMKCVRKPILIRIVVNSPYVSTVGNRPTIQGGLHFGPCSTERYQPFHIVSNRTVDCWYLKNNCTEEGQVLCDNETGDLDRTCRCDYTNGYAFVQLPKINFSCKPSEEDCSCYIKVCKNETHQLNPEYECVESYNSFDFNDTCLITEKSHDKKPETDSFSPFTVDKLTSVSDPIDSSLVASVSVVCLVVSAILFVVIVFTFGPFYVRRTKACSGEVQEGDQVVIEFGIYGIARIHNVQIRHREKFLDFEDVKYTVTEKNEYFCHTFTIRMNDVVLDDIGTYECIVSTLATRLGCKYKFTGKYYLSCKQYPGAMVVKSIKEQIKIHRQDDSYFRTSLVENALEILDSYNTLIIVGLEGSGKSKMCLEIAAYYRDKEFTVLIITTSDTRNAVHFIRPDKNDLYFFDVNLQSDQNDDLLKICKNFSKYPNLKFIITKSSDFKRGKLYVDKFEDKHHIRLDELCREDKIGISKKHMIQNRVNICDNSYESNYEDPNVIQNSEKPVQMYKKVFEKIIDTHAFTGFPLACQKFFSDRTLLHLEHRYFNTPPRSVIREINTLRNKKEVFDKLKYAVLVYIMMNERTSVKDIQRDDKLLTTVCENIDLSSCKSFQIKDAIEQLEGTFLKRSRNIFEFSHEIMAKAVWMSYIDIDAQLCVSTCKWSYIEDYIRPHTWPVHEYDVCVPVDNSLIITRLVKELSGGSSWSVGQYLLKCYQSCFQFINDFCQHYMEKENVKIDVLLTLCSAFSKVGTSFEVFKTCLVAKNKLFSSNIDQFGNCLWHYCVLQDYEGMISDIPDNDLDKIFNIVNTKGYSACHFEFYLGRYGMIEKHIGHIPRTFEYYSQLKKLYHIGERNSGRIIKTKHLKVIGQMDLLSDVLKETKFGSKQDFSSIREKLFKIKNEIMIMVRIKQLPSKVEDKEIEKVLETSYGCKIIKQYRERYRQNKKITNLETGDRIVICKPLKFSLPRQIYIAQFKVNIYHDDQTRKE